jgi:hypothetical protein
MPVQVVGDRRSVGLTPEELIRRSVVTNVRLTRFGPHDLARWLIREGLATMQGGRLTPTDRCVAIAEILDPLD